MKRTLTMIFTIGLLLTMTVGCESHEQSDKNSLTSNKETLKGIDDTMQISIQGEQGETIIFQLYDSNAAKSLYNQLPITIDIEDYSDDEKIFYPSKKLDVSDTSLAKGPAGTLAYYEPWGNVVIYYDDCKGSNGLYALGEAISGNDLISQLHGSVKITKYAGNEKQKANIGKHVEDTQSIAKEEEQILEQGDGMHHIQITIGTKIFTASLYDNEAVKELLARFPLTLQMDELHGNEKYYYFHEAIPSAAQSVSQIYTGDLKLFGSDCLVLFYKDFISSYSYTSLGQIDDPQGLSEALGNRSIQIQFSMNK